MMKTSFLVLLVLALHFSLLLAFPEMAGGCDRGVPSVGASHVSDLATTGSLKDGNITVTLNRIPLVNYSTVSINQNYKLEVRSPNGFRGLLVRVTGEDFTFTSDDENFQDAEACSADSNVPRLETIVGLSHKDNDLKNRASGDIKFILEQDFQVDITVVVSNNANDGSEYYFTSFQKLRAQDKSETLEVPKESLETASDGTSKTSVLVVCLFIVFLLAGAVLYHQARKEWQHSTFTSARVLHRTIT
jgi:hypothetical protein